jgi:hypothetical protein
MLIQIDDGRGGGRRTEEARIGVGWSGDDR